MVTFWVIKFLHLFELFVTVLVERGPLFAYIYFHRLVGMIYVFQLSFYMTFLNPYNPVDYYSRDLGSYIIEVFMASLMINFLIIVAFTTAWLYLIVFQRVLLWFIGKPKHELVQVNYGQFRVSAGNIVPAPRREGVFNPYGNGQWDCRNIVKDQKQEYIKNFHYYYFAYRRLDEEFLKFCSKVYGDVLWCYCALGNPCTSCKQVQQDWWRVKCKWEYINPNTFYRYFSEGDDYLDMLTTVDPLVRPNVREFMEGSFNPYGNGQTNPFDTSTTALNVSDRLLGMKERLDPVSYRTQAINLYTKEFVEWCDRRGICCDHAMIQAQTINQKALDPLFVHRSDYPTNRVLKKEYEKYKLQKGREEPPGLLPPVYSPHQSSSLSRDLNTEPTMVFDPFLGYIDASGHYQNPTLYTPYSVRDLNPSLIRRPPTFKEGSFNPYGNGQTEAQREARLIFEQKLGKMVSKPYCRVNDGIEEDKMYSNSYWSVLRGWRFQSPEFERKIEEAKLVKRDFVTKPYRLPRERGSPKMVRDRYKTVLESFDYELHRKAFINFLNVMYENNQFVSHASLEHKARLVLNLMYGLKGYKLKNGSYLKIHDLPPPQEASSNSALVGFLQQFPLLMTNYGGMKLIESHFSTRLNLARFLLKRFTVHWENLHSKHKRKKGYTYVMRKWVYKQFNVKYLLQEKIQMQMFKSPLESFKTELTQLAKEAAVGVLEDPEVNQKARTTAAEIVDESVGGLIKKLPSMLKESFAAFVGDDLVNCFQSVTNFITSAYKMLQEWVNKLLELIGIISPYVRVALLWLLIVIVAWKLKELGELMAYHARNALEVFVSSLFPSFTYSFWKLWDEIFQDKIQAQGKGSSSVIALVASVLLYICTEGSVYKRCTDVFSVGSRCYNFIDTLLGSATSVIDWVVLKATGEHLFEDRKVYDDVMDCIDQLSEYFKIENLSIRVITDEAITKRTLALHAHLSSLQLAIIRADAIPQHVRQHFNLMFAQLTHLKKMAESMSYMMQTRTEPVVIYLYGGPGQGKTISIDVICSALWDLLRNQWPDEYIGEYTKAQNYNRDTNSDYWEGYQHQCFTIFNDIMEQIDPAKRASTASDMLHMAESAPFSLNMAFGDKGTKFFTSSFIIITTNFGSEKDWKEMGMTCPSAFLRRLHLPLEVTRKNTLDYMNVGETCDNAWEFKVKFFKMPEGENDGGKTQKLGLCEGLEFGDKLTLTEVVKTAFLRFKANKEKPKLSVEANKVDWVKKCGFERKFDPKEMNKKEEQISWDQAEQMFSSHINKHDDVSTVSSLECVNVDDISIGEQMEALRHWRKQKAEEKMLSDFLKEHDSPGSSCEHSSLGEDLVEESSEGIDIDSIFGIEPPNETGKDEIEPQMLSWVGSKIVQASQAMSLGFYTAAQDTGVFIGALGDDAEIDTEVGRTELLQPCAPQLQMEIDEEMEGATKNDYAGYKYHLYDETRAENQSTAFQLLDLSKCLPSENLAALQSCIDLLDNYFMSFKRAHKHKKAQQALEILEKWISANYTHSMKIAGFRKPNSFWIVILRGLVSGVTKVVHYTRGVMLELLTHAYSNSVMKWQKLVRLCKLVAPEMVEHGLTQAFMINLRLFVDQDCRDCTVDFLPYIIQSFAHALSRVDDYRRHYAAAYVTGGNFNKVIARWMLYRNLKVYGRTPFLPSAKKTWPGVLGGGESVEDFRSKIFEGELSKADYAHIGIDMCCTIRQEIDVTGFTKDVIENTCFMYDSGRGWGFTKTYRSRLAVASHPTSGTLLGSVERLIISFCANPKIRCFGIPGTALDVEKGVQYGTPLPGEDLKDFSDPPRTWSQWVDKSNKSIEANFRAFKFEFELWASKCKRNLDAWVQGVQNHMAMNPTLYTWLWRGAIIAGTVGATILLTKPIWMTVFGTRIMVAKKNKSAIKWQSILSDPEEINNYENNGYIPFDMDFYNPDLPPRTDKDKSRLRKKFEAQSLGKGHIARMKKQQRTHQRANRHKMVAQCEDVTRKIIAQSAFAYVDRMSKVSRNIHIITLTYDTGAKIHGCCTFIHGTIAAIPVHYLCDKGSVEKIEIFQDNPGQNCITAHKGQFFFKDYRDISDLAFFKIHHAIMQSKPSLLSKLRREADPKTNPIDLIRVIKTVEGGKVCLYLKESLGAEFRLNTNATSSWTKNDGTELELAVRNYIIMYDGRGAQGQCGLPVISQAPEVEQYFEGIHVGQWGNDAIVAPITYEMVRDFDSMSMQAGEVPYQFVLPDAIVGAHPRCKNPVVSQPQSEGFIPPGFVYEGSFKKARIMPENTVFEPTVFQKEPPVFPVTVAPAKLATFYKDAQDALDYIELEACKVSPFRNGLDKFGAACPPGIPSWLFNMILSDPRKIYKHYVSKGVPRKKLHALSILETVFGNAARGIQSLDTEAAGGMELWCMGLRRSDVLNIEKGYLDELVIKEVERQEALASVGIYTGHVVGLCLKDELRDLPRVLEGKTRLFCVGSLINLIRVKMHLGELITLLKKHRGGTSCAVGVNPHGPEWKYWWTKLNNHRGNEPLGYCGGDISGYDLHLLWFFCWVFFLWCNEFYQYPEASADWHKLRAACYSIIATWYATTKDLMKNHKGNASGNWATGFINSFINYVMHHIIFIWSCRRNNIFEKFHKIVQMIVYGDDNTNSVDKKHASFWNMLIIRDGFKELFGMTYTDPLKGAVTEPFIDADDIVFLARKFKVSSDGSMILAPLEKDSIYGMLLWTRRSKVNTSREQLEMNIKCAAMEMFHYGPEEWEIFAGHVKNYCAREGITWTGKTYNYWLKRYHSQHFHNFQLTDGVEDLY